LPLKSKISEKRLYMSRSLIRIKGVVRRLNQNRPQRNNTMSEVGKKRHFAKKYEESETWGVDIFRVMYYNYIRYNENRIQDNIKMQIPLTTKVERYLFQCFRRRSELPDRIPSEQELCERLGVSLIIVRRAIANMIERQYLIRLPGRKGAFTNPNAQVGAKYAVGLFTQGSMQDFHYGVRLFLASFMNHLGTASCTLEFFLIPPEKKGTDWLRVVQDLSLDGAVVIHPRDKHVTFLEPLLQTDFPCVTILTDWSQLHEVPSEKYIGIDLAEFGRQRARLVAGLQKVVYISHKNLTYSAYEEERKVLGLSADQTIFINEKIEKKLSVLLKKQKIDAIISDGVYWMLRELFSTLNSRPEYQKIPIYANVESSSSKDFRQKYPALNLHFFPEDRISLYKKEGIIAVREILKMLSNPGYRFKGILLKDSDINNKERKNIK